ncbi:hypothetical protein AUJ65_02215 [Candidatus Micrarchaeota archaeon CG1_02_51_15]|nr:MAG: hypothetical protein AUJ65_02215 [Candidatus Micrarchaeota archaeon CG1_02_51_15]
MLLINLPYLERVYSGLKQAVAIQPPLGLAYIAAYLREHGVSAEIIDANALEMQMPQLVKVAAASQHQFVGVTCTTNTIYLAYEFATKLKAISPEKKVVLGGVHVTFADEDTLKECPAIDFVVRGEGELTTLKLVSESNLGQINGLTYRDSNGAIKRNPDATLIMDLNQLPFPARDLLPIDKYRPGTLFNIGQKGSKYMTILSSRGCPNKCVFCSSAYFWHYLRIRSPENIIAEIDFLHEKYGVKHLHFLDDTLTVPKARMEKVCDLLIERNYGIEWNTFSRADIVDEALLSKMRKAGCYGITFGVESGNEDILRRIRKNVTKEQVRTAVNTAKKIGLDTHCDFMLGLPDDDEKTMQDTIDFAIELDPNVALFSITTPFPGTDLFYELKTKGVIQNTGWGNASLHEASNIGNGKVDAATIRKYYNRAYSSFYYRPKYALNAILRLSKHPREIAPFALGMLYKLTENKRE